MDPITSTINPALTAYTLATVPPLPNDVTSKLFVPIPAPDRIIKLRLATSPPRVRNGSRGWGDPIVFSGVSGDLVPFQLTTTTIGKVVDKRQIAVQPINQTVDPLTLAAALAKMEAMASDTWYHRALPLQNQTPGVTYGTVASQAAAPWDTEGTSRSSISEASRVVRDYCGVDQSGLSVVLYGKALDAGRNDPLFLEQRSKTVYGAQFPDLQGLAAYWGVAEVTAGFGNLTLENGARQAMYLENAAVVYYQGNPVLRMDPAQGDLLFAANYQLFQNALTPWFDNDHQSYKTAWEIENLSIVHHPGSAYLLTNVHS